MTPRPNNVHERLADGERPAPGSDRAFGAAFAIVFAVVGAVAWIRGGAPTAWPFVVSGAFLVAALLTPELLTPLNKIWFKVASLLRLIISPIALALLFYGVFAPTGAALRLLRRDPLRLRRDPNAESYWIAREPPGPDSESMRRQY